MLDVRFREKFQGAMAGVIGDQERAGLDIVTHGDLHVDEDMAGRAWHHYLLQRWAGFEGKSTDRFGAGTGCLGRLHCEDGAEPGLALRNALVGL